PSVEPPPATVPGMATQSTAVASSEPFSESAPTPWSDPVPETTSSFAAPASFSDSTPSNGWQMPAPETAPLEGREPALPVPASEVSVPDDPWGAVVAEPAQEWQAEAAPTDWQEVRKPKPESVPEAAPSDWSTLRTGPDWSAPAASAEAANDAWGTPPPAPENS